MKDMQWKVFIIEHDDFNAHVYPVSNLTICIDQSNWMIVLHIFTKVLGFGPGQAHKNCPPKSNLHCYLFNLMTSYCRNLMSWRLSYFYKLMFWSKKWLFSNSFLTRKHWEHACSGIICVMVCYRIIIWIKHTGMWKWYWTDLHCILPKENMKKKWHYLFAKFRETANFNDIFLTMVTIMKIIVIVIFCLMFCEDLI